MINFKKSQITTVKEIDFFGLVINSVNMTFALPQILLQVTKEIWDYLLANGIAVTAEYLPSSLNIQADWQSRNHRDSSDWKLNPKIFSQIVKIRGIPQIDLFAS